MSETPRGSAETRPTSPWFRLGLGLLLTPCALMIAARTLPQVQVGLRAADVIAFGGATLIPILGLAVAATAEVSFALALAVALPATAALLVLAFVQPAASTALLLVDTALVCLAWAFGTSLGKRVQHASHLFPACVVAASADLVSLVSPEGPSHAIAESDRALSLLAVWFPVPGTHAIAPALGVGDLVFMALVFGVARAHRLPYVRSVLLCASGTAVAGFAAGWFGVAVPALVPIAAAVVLGLPAIRQLRRADRGVARLAMLLALSVAVASAARSLLLRH